MLNVNLFKNIISNLITKVQSAEANEMRKILENLSPTIPVELTPECEFFKSGEVVEHIVEKINLPLGSEDSIKRIKRLHDGSFIVMSTDAPIKHYSADFSTVSDIPFKFIAPTSGEPQAYLNPADIEVINYTLSGVTGSYLFVIQTANHIVQVYKYVSGVWSFALTVGTLDTAGHAADNLSQPVAISGALVTENNVSTFELNISCLGAGPNTEVGFIKKMVVSTNNTVASAGSAVISYPKQVVNAASPLNGSLLHSETKNVARLKVITPKEKIAVLSETMLEFGFLKISGALPQTEFMTKGDIKSIHYNDSIKNPTAFDVSGDSVIIGDERGHIAVLNNSLKEVQVFFGKHKGSGINTTYPNEFAAIEDILVDGSTVYFISDKALYKSNVLQVNDNIFNFVIPAGATGSGGLATEYYIQDYFGNKGYQEVTFSIDNSKFYPIEKWRNKVVLAGQDLYIRVKVKKEDVLNFETEAPRLLLLIAI